MTVLKGLKELKGGIMILTVSDGEEIKRLFVPTRVYRNIGAPVVGCSLDGAMDELLFADELYRAEKKALSLLSYADNNVQSLKVKLVRAGFSREAVDDVASQMLRLGYINEQRQLERLILNEANVNLKGPYKIIPKLAAKGYSVALIKSVFKELCESGEIDLNKNRQKLIAKKLGEDADGEQKRILLYKNGFSPRYN